MLLNMHPVLDHSLAVVEAIVLLVAVGKVAVLEVVNVKVHLSSKVSLLKSLTPALPSFQALASLTVVDVIEFLLAA